MSPLYRYALCILAALALVAGSLGYRSHLLSAGHAEGLAEAQANATEARLLASRADALAAERSRARVAATLTNLKDSHEKTTARLRAALIASDHRSQRLSVDVARLHDEAAGLRAGLAGNPGESQGSPGTAEAPYSVADLIQTTNENYSICLRNGARLGALQDWYESLRKGDASKN